ncbi:MAG: cytochrome c oxidase subunit II [Gemmataceae bacterium]|nr:cytochrome c oxidase subunit II [Gemmataceae bacterium]
MSLLPFIPDRAATLADHFELLFWYIAVTSTVVGLAVYAAIVYFCVQYRRGNTEGHTPRILGSTRLELAWTIIPLFVFLSYFAGGVVVYNHHVHPPADAEEVYVFGKQWMWKAQYPGGQRVIIGGNPRNMTQEERNSIGKLVLKVNKPVKIQVTSEDVIHDFGIPAFRSKVDALPGRYTTVWYHPTQLGEYHIYCDQYCGTWHSLMVGKVLVVKEEDYDAILAGFVPMPGTNNAMTGSQADEGAKQWHRLQCGNCHSANAQARAPVLEGLYGSKVPIRDNGGRVGYEIADAHFIKESIRRPRAKVADGWEAIMPPFGPDQVTDAQLDSLVAYIRSLRKGSTPDNNQNWVAPVLAPGGPKSQSSSGGN